MSASMRRDIVSAVVRCYFFPRCLLHGESVLPPLPLPSSFLFLSIVLASCVILVEGETSKARLLAPSTGVPSPRLPEGAEDSLDALQHGLARSSDPASIKQKPSL